MLTSAVLRYFSALRITCAPVVLPRILPIRSMPSSARVRSAGVTVTCLPVYSTCMVKAPFRKRIPTRNGDCTSSANAALVGAGNSQIFAVFGHGSPGHIDPLALQHGGDLVVGERLAGIFVFNHFFHLALEQHERGAGALRAIYALGKEEAQLVDALRGVHIFI